MEIPYPLPKVLKLAKYSLKNGIELPCGYYWIMLHGKKTWDIGKWHKVKKRFYLHAGSDTERHSAALIEIDYIDTRRLKRATKFGRAYIVAGDEWIF